MTILDQIKDAVVMGRIRNVEKLIMTAIGEKIPVADILENAIVPGMTEAGEQFKCGDGNIPMILSSARCVRCGLEVLRPYLERDGYHQSGRIILGTVEGDLHDIGKNMVALMFEGAGFEVIDLGVDVSEKQFLQAVRENPDVSIVCISSLLTTGHSEMRHVVRALRREKNGSRLKIMVGGGSVTKEFAREIGADAYTDNAVDAAETAKTFII